MGTQGHSHENKYRYWLSCSIITIIALTVALALTLTFVFFLDNDDPSPTALPTDNDLSELFSTATMLPTSTIVSVVQANEEWLPVLQTVNGTEMVLVPPGCFIMGWRGGEDDELPVHEICFTKPFYIDRTEVTRAAFDQCVEVGFCSETIPSDFSTAPDQPINRVSWIQARDYCQWRSSRLPTEAEWEYAARGPDNWLFPWGNIFDLHRAVFEGNAFATKPVGIFPLGASWVGAVDMSGNVWEWVSSIFRAYPYDASDGREMLHDTTTVRVMRGGSFSSDQLHLLATYRNWDDPANRNDGLVGFRCAADLTPMVNP